MGIFQQFPYSNFHEMNLDQIIKIMREMQDEWATTKTEWASYKEFIDNYFENLDVSDEVLAALRIMAADGTLNTILDPVISEEITNWLEEHITPTTPVIDSSLTISGAGADAKVAGDYIRNIINHNSYDYLKQVPRPNRTDSGITFTYNAVTDTYTITGTASGTTFNNIYANSAQLPDGIIAGEKYFIKHHATNVLITVLAWDSGGNYSYLLNGYESAWITIPAGTVGLTVRLGVVSGTTTNETIPVPQVLNNIDNEYLSESMMSEFIISPDTWFENSSTNTLRDLLARGYNIRFTDGVYPVTLQVEVPEGRTIKGSGKDTILEYSGSGNFITTTGGNVTIKDLTLKSALTDRPATYDNTGETGIVVFNETTKPVVIDNVNVIGFSKNGIDVNNSGYSSLVSAIISNVYCRYCGTGIFLGQQGEYAVITNSIFTKCYYGVVNNAGNNKFSNCGFDSNSTGMFMQHTYNDAHSGASNCSFNHNVEYALRTSGLTGGFTFSNCMFFLSHSENTSDIAVYNSKGIIFHGCLFGRDAKFGLNKGTDGGMCLLANCLFENAPSFTIINNMPVVKDHCYLNDGTPVV